MEGLTNFKLDDLNTQFLDFDGVEKDEQMDIDNLELTFGPTDAQLKSYDAWKGCDGKFFHPFNKRDKIGKIADYITAAAQLQKEKEREAEMKRLRDLNKNVIDKKKPQGNQPQQIMPQPSAEEDKIDEWEMTEETNRKRVTKKQDNAAANKDAQNQRWEKQGQQQKTFGQGQKMTRKQVMNRNYHNSVYTKYLRSNLRENSIDPPPSWTLLAEITKLAFDRLPFLKPVFLKNAKECGEVSQYDNKWEKATGRKPLSIEPFEGHTFEEMSLFEDKKIIELVQDGAADIFMTDVVAATLMTISKSNYSFDLEIKKHGHLIFIDKRQSEDEEDKLTNLLNFQTVCENSVDFQPYDDASVNGIKQLMQEAQKINNSWTHVCQDKSKQIEFDEGNPFIEDENQVAQRVGYHYKIWKLQDANADLGIPEKKICIRCEIHTHTGKLKDNGEKQYMNVYALNEHNLDRSNWRQQLDKSIITCFNKELTDNSFKISRWIVQSLLSDVDMIKFAFISRKKMDDPTKKHCLLGTHTVKTQQLAKQLNMNMDKMWPIIKRLLEEIEQPVKKEEGQEEQKKEEDEEDDEDGDAAEFVLLKDVTTNNKLEFKIFKKDLEDDDDEEEEEQIQS